MIKKHALEVIIISLNSINLPNNFPLGAVKEAIKLVMSNYIVELGHLYFLHLLVTAMGTSVACVWATIFCAVHEMGKSMP